MVKDAQNLRIAVHTFCYSLRQDPSPLIRAIAAKTLGKLGSEEAINSLCQAWLEDTDINVRRFAADAIVLILNPQVSKIMSDSSKIQMNFNAPVTGVSGNVEGDMIVNPQKYD